MKKHILLLISLITVLAPITLIAQEVILVSSNVAPVRVLYKSNGKRIEKALVAYQRILNHPVSAIVESAMFNLLVLKIDYPELEYKQVLKKLDELSLNGKTSVIRYKAHLTSEFIKNPSLLTEVEASDFNKYMDVEKADQFYLALSNVLQKQLATLN